MISDLTIVIQGRCEDDKLQMWLSNYSDWNVIISTWYDYVIPFEVPLNWKVVKSNQNEIPDFVGKNGMQNLEYQIISSLAGLNLVKTKYSIKVRGDEYWSNLDKIKFDDTKLICGSMYFRPIDYTYPFHIGDHIIAGTTDNLKDMFNKTFSNLLNDVRPMNTPEVLLGWGYVQQKENISNAEMFSICDRMVSKPYLQKWFDIIDVNELSPFISSCKEAGTGDRKYIENYFDNCGCITKI
jgi:hypothetical protein